MLISTLRLLWDANNTIMLLNTGAHPCEPIDEQIKDNCQMIQSMIDQLSLQIEEVTESKIIAFNAK